MATIEQINSMVRSVMENGGPDADDSPAAVWLGQVHDAAQEAWDDGRFSDESDEDESGVMHELATDTVPYENTYTLWRLFVDALAYCNSATDERPMSSGGEDPTNWAGSVLEEMAHQGIYALVESLRESQQEADDAAEESQAEYDAEHGDGLELPSYGS